jgi:hypothetical protein
MGMEALCIILFTVNVIHIDYQIHHTFSHSQEMRSFKRTFLLEISAHQRSFLSARCASAWMDRSTSVCHQRKCKHNPLFDQENACGRRSQGSNMPV